MGTLSKATWALVEEEFRANVKPLTTIASEYGIDSSAIHQKAKRLGWIRKPHEASQERIDALIGASQEKYAGAIQTGLEISINCLNGLKSASESATDAREIKVIQEATSLSVKTIREIAGWDKSDQQGNTTTNIQINNAEQIAVIIGQLQEKY